MVALDCSRATAFRILQRTSLDRSSYARRYARLVRAWHKGGLETQLRLLVDTQPGGPLSLISREELDADNARFDAKMAAARKAARMSGR